MGMLHRGSRLQVKTPNLLLSCRRHPRHPQGGNLIRNSSTGLLRHHRVVINAQAKLYLVEDMAGEGLGILKREDRREQCSFKQQHHQVPDSLAVYACLLSSAAGSPRWGDQD